MEAASSSPCSPTFHVPRGCPVTPWMNTMSTHASSARVWSVGCSKKIPSTYLAADTLHDNSVACARMAWDASTVSLDLVHAASKGPSSECLERTSPGVSTCDSGLATMRAASRSVAQPEDPDSDRIKPHQVGSEASAEATPGSEELAREPSDLASSCMSGAASEKTDWSSEREGGCRACRRSMAPLSLRSRLSPWFSKILKRRSSEAASRVRLAMICTVSLHMTVPSRRSEECCSQTSTSRLRDTCSRMLAHRLDWRDRLLSTTRPATLALAGTWELSQVWLTMEGHPLATSTALFRSARDRLAMQRAQSGRSTLASRKGSRSVACRMCEDTSGEACAMLARQLIALGHRCREVSSSAWLYDD